jgi:hypothetical protein
VPVWSQPPVARQLVPAALAGAWQENNAADRAALGRLAGADYSTMAEAMVPWAAALDSPLRRAGDAWKIASPRDAWFRLARFVTAADLDTFASVALEVLAADAVGDDHALAEVPSGTKPTEPQPSDLLRAGICESIAILAVHGGHASAVPNAEARPAMLVHRLLDGADRRRWITLARSLRALAEAAPDAFLTALDNALGLPEPAVMALFEEHGSGHSQLLWALETLAWDADYFARAALALAMLSRLDPGGRIANRPKESLRSLFLLWNPQTATPLDQRLRVLKVLRRKEPGSAWELMLGIMPSGHDSISPSPKPRWRDMPTEAKEVVTYGLIGRGAATILDWLLEDVGTSSDRWLSIIELLPNIEPDRRASALHRLSGVVPNMNDGAERMRIRTAIRRLLHRHREFPDAEWSLPESELSPVEAIYQQLCRGDVANDTEWLFADPFPDLPDPSPKGDFHADQTRAAALRREAVERIHAAEGVSGVLRLIRPTVQASLVGRALSEAAVLVKEKHNAATRALLEIGDRGADFVHGLLAKGHTDADQLRQSLADSARQDNWPPTATVLLLLAMRPEQATWTLAREFGTEVEDQYWARVSPFFIRDDDAGELAYAIRNLLDAGRPREALSIVGRSPAEFGPDLLMETLLAAAGSPPPETAHSNDRVMFEWCVQQALEQLDKTGVAVEQIARVELAYLPMLNLARHYPSGRPPKAVYRLLAEHPETFVEVMCMLYRPSAESGIVEERDPSDPAAKTRAHNAWDLLHHFDHVPGTQQPDGIDGRKLEAWVATARRLCADVGRGEVGDQQIGQLLAHAPADADGAWPHSAIRDVIEISRSRHLEIGVQIGRQNMRGATWRGLEDGGAQERDLAAQYRAWSKATAFEWPRTSALLARVAQDYEADGRWHDERRESDDWRY